MIDVHTHVLPGVDHGSASVDESLVSDVFCTSHYYCAEKHVDEFLVDYDGAFASLKQANDTGVKLHRGAEVTVSRYFHYTRPRSALCLGGGNHLLVELPFSRNCDEWVFECIGVIWDEYRIVPVIAHPERYPYVQKSPRILDKFVALGAKIQVNSGSFFVRPTRRALKYMVKRGIIDFVASDAHYVGGLCPSREGITELENKRKGYGAYLEQNAQELLATVEDSYDKG